MKIQKILILVLFSMILVSCNESLFEDISLSGARVEKSENVKIEGNIITVAKGTPVNFVLDGDPDYITFFSGEIGHQYVYSHRMEGNLDDIVKATLKFKVWANYGITNKGDEANSLKNQMQVLYATEDENGIPVFPGLSGDFEKDSIMVEQETAWNMLVPLDKMPEKTGSGNGKNISFDLTPYLDKKFTLAFVQNREQKLAPVDPSDPKSTIIQSTFLFENMYIETEWKNGKKTKQLASSFGLTPLNMKNKTVFEDHKDNIFDMPLDMEYGAVKTNVEGYWNFNDISSGNFQISGCAKDNKWKYSWLVSDYLNFSSVVEPDQGVKVKDINLPVKSYSHTYSTVGTYKATFLMNNINYDESQQKVCEFVINVVETL